MKSYFTLLTGFFSISILLVLIISCALDQDIKISVANLTELAITDAFVTVELDNELGSFSLYDGTNEIPYQILSSKEIGFVLNLDPKETKILSLIVNGKKTRPEFKSRTYAELSMKTGNVYFEGKFHGDKFVNVSRIRVPQIHTDHDALFRYEGPGWESEKVGYRFYLDWRNANDIFGKKVSRLLLSEVGVHDTVAQDDSYHSMLDWGMDIFNVGKSLGIGSIGMWNDDKVNMVSKTDSIICEIPENGPVRSEVKTSYFGWQVGEKKYDLISTLSIAAGSRLTKCEIDISNKPDNIVTGLAKYKGTDFVKGDGKGDWNYIALYGVQTLVKPPDKLGIAVLYKQADFIELTEDELSYVLKLKPGNGKAEYYFCAAWEQEPDGIKNEKDFSEYLDNTIKQLDHPVIAKIN